MIVRFRRIETTFETKKGKYLSQMLVDDGKDTDAQLIKVLTDKKPEIKEGVLIVLNPTEDGKLHFYRKEYEAPSSTTPRAVGA